MVAVATGDGGGVVAVEQGEVGFEAPGEPFVIGVEEGEHRAAGFGDSPVARRAGAGIVLGDEADPGVGVARGKLAAAVAGAVVDDDDFESGARLAGDGTERALEIGRLVVERDDYRNADAHLPADGSGARRPR